MKPEIIFEVSFECGNKVGGIHTVISTKAGEMIKRFGDKYITIGFYNPIQASKEFVIEDSSEFKNVFEEMRKYKINCYYGRWVNAKNARLILLDISNFYSNRINGEECINYIKKWLWEKYGVDSIRAGIDFIEPVVWGYATGMLLENICRDKKCVVNFHEWLSASAMLYLIEKCPNVGCVFTTHATVFGRAKGIKNTRFFIEIRDMNRKDVNVSVEEAKKLNVEHKHTLERAAVHNCHVFTAVSEGLAEECKYVLGRYPDIITVNGLDMERIPTVKELSILHTKKKDKIIKFLNSYFEPYYTLRDDKIVLFTSGRYEFYNKGFDIFIEALGRLNQCMKERNINKDVFAFILVPSSIKSIKEDIDYKLKLIKRLEEMFNDEIECVKDKLLDVVLENKNLRCDEVFRKNFINQALIIKNHIKTLSANKNPYICPFLLTYREEDDMILNTIKSVGLNNMEEDRVKVIFYPRYLAIVDDLLGMSYYDVVIASSIGVFPSRYESWGYTPHEAAAYLNISVTTNLSGFGRFIEKTKKLNEGIKVLDMFKDKEYVVNDLSNFLFKIITMKDDERFKKKIEARTLVEITSWKNVVENYIKAYEIAIQRASKQL